MSSVQLIANMLKYLPIVALVVSSGVVQATTTINPTQSFGTWEGWGVSLAWWAAKFGDQEDLASLLFSTEWTTYNGVLVPGIGLNIVRYNAGASSWNTYDDTSMVVSPNMISSRQVEGYWLNWESKDPASNSWNWTMDANQRAMMVKAKSKGANHFELFSNSPMWWMTVSKNPAGNADANVNNLQDWNYGDHAIYLAQIALKAKTSWGITFESVEALNEPGSAYWSATGTQEGCKFDPASQARAVITLRNEMNAIGLSDMTVAASDETSYDLAYSTWNSFNSTAKASVARVNVHGYQGASGNRDGLYDVVSASGKKLWNSEYGESDATGAKLASNLILDLIWLHPTAWVYWQALDGGGWGLIDSDVEGGTIGAVSQKYYVLAHFSRHIREGMTILDGGADNTVAAYDAAAKKLVIVAVNWGADQYLTFDLSKFTQGGVDGAVVTRWSTHIGTGDQYLSYTDTTLSGTQFWSYFAANQIMTFEISNVSL